jgi:hypothetical protein
MRFLQRINEMKAEEVEAFEAEDLLLWESLVVEGQAPGQITLLLVYANQSVKLGTNGHVPRRDALDS